MTDISGPLSPLQSIVYDPDTSSWKTCQGLSGMPSPTFSGIFPRPGTMRSGHVSARPKSELFADASGGGSSLRGIVLSPPDGTSLEGSSVEDGAPPLWPTPTRQNGSNKASPSQARRDTPPLTTVVVMFPTPTASEGEGGPDKRQRKEGQNLRSFIGGVGLNPDWTELLMGAPLGWTDVLVSLPLPGPGSTPHGKTR